MVWFSPEQNEMLRLRSQQKSSHDDSYSKLRELEVRAAWEGGLGSPCCLSDGLSVDSQ